MSTAIELAISGSLGVASGALSGFLGMGGGSILPPLLGLLLGVDQHLAQGISLAALLPPVGLPAVLAYRRAGVAIDRVLVTLLILGFVFGVAGGAWIAHRVPARDLSYLFAGFLVVTAWRALASTTARGEVAEPQREPNRRAGLPIGIVAGVMSGLLGGGGGIVTVPLLRKLAKLGRLEAQATTLAVLLPPIGLPAVLVYAREQGGLPWPLLGAVGVGFALGAGVGAKLAGRVSTTWAMRVYAAFLAVVAFLLVLR